MRKAKFGGPLTKEQIDSAKNWTTDPGVVANVTFSQPKMNWLTLMPSGIRIDMETGEVVIPDGLSLSDAARAFWEAVGHIARPAFR
jgi:hypothetical protein